VYRPFPADHDDYLAALMGSLPIALGFGAGGGAARQEALAQQKL